MLLGGVVPNPHLSKVYEGIELAKKEGVDFILAVGGGSVIDSAKAIAYGIANEGDVWDFYDKRRVPTACAPIGTVLTISAAGSEMSNSSVITKEEGWLKRGLNTDLCRPKFAVMNPELTMTLPEYQTMSGCTDIMMHTMERYFSHEKDTMLVDAMAEGLLKTVMTNAKILLEDPLNYDARAEIMWAGSLSHNGLTGCGGVGPGDWATHQLEHELSGMFDVAHGAGLAAVWSSWARYVMPTKPERFAQYAHNVFAIPDSGDAKADGEAGICAFEDFMHEVGMPTRIHEMGIELTDEQLEELTVKCTFFGRRKIGRFQTLDHDDIKKIYEMAR